MWFYEEAIASIERYATKLIFFIGTYIYCYLFYLLLFINFWSKNLQKGLQETFWNIS